MRKRKYLIGALLGVIGSVVLAGAASATVTSQSVSSIINPPKAPKKTFVAVKSMKTTVDTNYSGAIHAQRHADRRHRSARTSSSRRGTSPSAT